MEFLSGLHAWCKSPDYVCTMVHGIQKKVVLPPFCAWPKIAQDNKQCYTIWLWQVHGFNWVEISWIMQMRILAPVMSSCAQHSRMVNHPSSYRSIQEIAPRNVNLRQAFYDTHSIKQKILFRTVMQNTTSTPLWNILIASLCRLWQRSLRKLCSSSTSPRIWCAVCL